MTRPLVDFMKRLSGFIGAENFIPCVSRPTEISSQYAEVNF